MNEPASTKPPGRPSPMTNVFVVAALAAAIYGVLVRFVLGLAHANSAAIVSEGFIFLAPLAIGYLAIYQIEIERKTNVLTWIFFPWLPATLCFLIALLFLLEGVICIVFIFPAVLLFSSIGGVLAGVITRKFTKSKSTMVCAALLPFVVAMVEANIQPPSENRVVHSQVLIHASPQVVWDNIKDVRAIAPSELKSTWTHAIGFPRPIAATLSHAGVGGVRTATFEHGLTFFETVTDWQPNQRLSFRIKADTEHIPPTTLDEHVTIGGRYFDVLHGEYQIEPLSNGDVMLHLLSSQRLSTDFNTYASFWTDAVMQDLQTSILDVIRNRCEQVPAS